MFDALTAAALADQLTNEVEGGRVQQVGLLSRQAIWLEVYANRRRRYLIASAESDTASAYLADEEPVSDRQLVTPLLLLLRKYVRGARLVGVQQPPLERHLTLTFAWRPRRIDEAIEPETVDSDEDEDTDEEEESTFTHLHLEIMGRHSNLILVDDDGLIMESAKRVTPAMSRVRPIAPRRPYVAPPLLDRADPRRATEGEVRPLIDGIQREREQIRALTSHYRGLSPQVAREGLFLASGTDGGIDAAALARELRRLYEPLLTDRWQPVTYLDEDGLVVAYSAQPLASLAAQATEQPVGSISRAIEAGSGIAAPASEAGKHALRSRALVAAISEAIARLDARAASLSEQEVRHSDRERLRTWGETIYGYMWQIKPGDTELVVDDLRIPLDPTLSPSEQARRYLEGYQDAKSSDSRIAGAREEIESRRTYLAQMLTLAENARSVQDIEELEAEWFASQPESNRGKPPKRSTGKKRTLPALVFRDQPIYIGHSGAENDRVTFDIAGPDDTWLHARGVPGSHVIIKWTPSVRNEPDVLQRAAELAAYYSGSRASGRVEVDITERRHVRKIKGSGPGMVTYRNERTISVPPRGL
ncbi:MAG: NFACT family protein [Chloroflexota bacterium]|nr:NFACT family protein [Chloroflexota bacterium]